MKKIKFKNLPHQDHADFLDDMEKMSEMAFSFVVEEMITEIVEVLISSKLAKSDELKRGWTGKVPKIEIDFEKKLGSVLDKYMNALRYVLMGDAAGKAAKTAAESIGLDKKIVPGVIFGAYLDSLDTHREYYEQLTGNEPNEVPKGLLDESMNTIHKRTGKFVDESLLKLRNRIVDALDQTSSSTNNENINEVHEAAHELMQSGETATKAVSKAAKKAETKMDAADLKRSLRESADSYKNNWKQMVHADMAIASAVGTHQVVSEVYGADDGDVKVAWVAFRDEKTCQFCKNASRNPDGSFKLYRLSDFEPAGYNYGRKKQDWRLCIPGAHPNCRCSLVYVPKGFKIDNNGNVSPA